MVISSKYSNLLSGILTIGMIRLFFVCKKKFEGHHSCENKQSSKMVIANILLQECLLLFIIYF